MPIPIELRAPISEEQPAGEDLSGSDEHAEVERLFRSAHEPARMGPGGVTSDSEVTFADVSERAAAYLEQSKNLKIGALLSVAMLHQEGLASMAEGLELLRDWLEKYWDAVHPITESRLAVLSWLGSDDVSHALNLAPLTAAYGSGLVAMGDPGHRLAEYRLWLANETDGGKPPAGVDKEAFEAAVAGFERGFADSSRGWYRAQQKALNRCEAAWRALDVLANTRYDQKIRQKWGYVSQYEKAGAGDAKGAFAKGLKALDVPIRDLLARKPPEPGERPESIQESADGPVTEGESGTSASGARDPETPEEAAGVLRSAIRFLRRAAPTNPAPYLMARGWRWGELRGEGETIGPRLLEAPTTTERVRLKSLYLDQNWSALLDDAEETMATPVGRGWLDLQRYAIVAATKLGPEYRYVVAGLEAALKGLLTDFPGLVRAAMMDDLPTASPDTQVWLDSRGFSKGAVVARSEAVGAGDSEPGDAVREAAYSRAAQMAQTGDSEGAIAALLERAKREGSQRARFLTKAQAAGIMVSHGMTSVARHILDELDKLIAAHNLDEWESSEVVTQPLSLMIRCLPPGDPDRATLQERLARLDPLLAMRVAADGAAPEAANG